MSKRTIYARVALSCVLASGCGNQNSYPTAPYAPRTDTPMRRVSAPAQTVWVANQHSSTLTGYGSGNKPAFTISGSYTGLQDPRSVAADNGAGKLYVANSTYSSKFLPLIIFARDANGNVSPIGDIKSVYFTEYISVALDPSENIWVASDNPGLESLLVEFAAGAHGASTPIAKIAGNKTTLASVEDIATDSSANIYVVDFGSEEVAEFAAGSNGNVAPVRVITGKDTGFKAPYGIAVDQNGYIYVVDYKEPSVKVFSPDQNGNVYPQTIIRGSYTDLESPVSVALDSQANIYVGDVDTNAVYEFAAGSSGNVAPIRTITKGIADPFSISVCDASPPCETAEYGSTDHRLPRTAR